jgi:hypothetical protein
MTSYSQLAQHDPALAAWRDAASLAAPTAQKFVFWERVVEDSSGCWLWTGPKNKAGYGQMRLRNRKPIFVHRVAWELSNAREVPVGMLVCHHCDVRSCVRPDHLFLGTYRDNNRDMTAKGRNASQRITHCPLGHVYDKTNTWVHSGRRECRKCARTRRMIRYYRSRQMHERADQIMAMLRSGKSPYGNTCSDAR